MPHSYYSASHIPCRFLLIIPRARRDGGPHKRILFPSTEVWHVTLRFTLPGVGLTTPVDLGRASLSAGVVQLLQ